MKARQNNEAYQDLELGTHPIKEKAATLSGTFETLKTAAETTTARTFRMLGFYPEFSFKENTFLLFFSLLSAYETYAPVNKGSNELFSCLAEKPTADFASKSIAGIISLIVMIAALRGMGKGLRRIDLYAEQLIQHGEKLKLCEAQLGQIQKLSQELAQTKQKMVSYEREVKRQPTDFWQPKKNQLPTKVPEGPVILLGAAYLNGSTKAPPLAPSPKIGKAV